MEICFQAMIRAAGTIVKVPLVRSSYSLVAMFWLCFSQASNLRIVLKLYVLAKLLWLRVT